MATASRRTLPPRHSPSPLAGTSFLGFLAALVVVLFYLQPAMCALFGALLVVGGLAELWDRVCQGKLAAQRPGESICTFVRGFDYRHADTRVIRAVYEELQPWYAFPLRADDELDGNLRIDAESLEMDIAPALAERTGRSLADAQGNPHFGRVRTVADLVAFFCAQPFTMPAQE